jgi:hypothetical protein
MILIRFNITAAAPNGNPLPIDIHARKPDKPAIITPKPGIKMDTTERIREAIPNARNIGQMLRLRLFYNKSVNQGTKIPEINNKTL